MKESWGVYDIYDDYDELEEIHVVPEHDELQHTLLGSCLCEPALQHDPANRLPIYVHNAVLYN